MWFRAFALLFLLLLGGCRPAPQHTTLAPAAKVLSSLPRDDLGREIKLARVPQRIVTIGPGATEILFAIGAGARLVGRDSGSDYPAQAKTIPIVADFSGPSFEQVVAVRPDFIIAQGETWDKSRIELWQRKCGAPVAALRATNFRQVWNDIEKIGAWLDVKAAARALSVRMAKESSGWGVHERTHQPRAFFEVARSPLWTAGAGTLVDEVVEAADFNNVAHDMRGYKQYNLEVLQAKNPDVYIVADNGLNRERALAALRRNPGLRDLPCIRRGRVIVVSADAAMRPGPRLGQAVRHLYLQWQSLNQTPTQ